MGSINERSGWSERDREISGGASYICAQCGNDWKRLDENHICGSCRQSCLSCGESFGAGEPAIQGGKNTGRCLQCAEQWPAISDYVRWAKQYGGQVALTLSKAPHIECMDSAEDIYLCARTAAHYALEAARRI